MSDTRTSKDWAAYERFGSIEARPYADGDQADLYISFSLADLNRTSLNGGMIARNPANANDQWYIAPDYFAKHYRAVHEPPAVLPEGFNAITDERLAQHLEVTCSTTLRSALTELQIRRAAPPPALEWQPIETAPTDGTPVLVSNDERDGAWIAYYQPVYSSGYRPDNPWSSLMLNMRWHTTKWASTVPTKWMPIPAPYSAATKFASPE